MAYLRKLNVITPGLKYSQNHLANVLTNFMEGIEGGNKWTSTIHKLFTNTKIESRNLMWDPAGIAQPRRAEELYPDLVKENTEVACEAISKALEDTTLKPEDIDNVFFSSPVFSAPSISMRAMNQLPFKRDVKHWPMMGLGCAGGVALLGRASDYLRAYPRQSAIVLTVESGTRFWHGTLNTTFNKLLSHQVPDKEKMIQQILVAALFGDAVSCSILHGPLSPILKRPEVATRGPMIVDYASFLLPDSVDLVSHHAEESGIQSYLSPELGKKAPKAMVDTVNALLQKHNLVKKDIGHWMVHAGGPKMLEYFESEFAFTKGQLKHCWTTLNEVGNISSATVPRSYELTLENERDKLPGSWGVMVTAGPGLLIEALLLKWA